jgi:glycosyltransferase involved in cell wall biosynthesis
MSDRANSHKPQRILIATHAPLLLEFGAGQMAINLAEALRIQGHDVTLWSPHPMSNRPSWWHRFQNMQLIRAKLDTFLDTQEPFDAIDCLGMLITKKVSRSGKLVVARSVQPEILYTVSNLLDLKDKTFKKLVFLPFHCLLRLADILLTLQGWARATYIICLGSLELEWMNKWFPWWRRKLILYLNSLSKNEQLEFAKICLNRVQNHTQGIRFIWIGRWVAHKGIQELTDFIIHRAASNPQDTFTIAGCGNNAERDFPPQLISKGRLRFIPSFERSEIYTLLANHDVGLFTSKVEGWGLSLNEMLESGLPVFATRAGAVPDLEPFFETLMQFPPQQQILPIFLSTSHQLENYYTYFSWEKVAEVYAAKIFSSLNFTD